MSHAKLFVHFDEWKARPLENVKIVSSLAAESPPHNDDPAVVSVSRNTSFLPKNRLPTSGIGPCIWTKVARLPLIWNKTMQTLEPPPNLATAPGKNDAQGRRL